MNCPIEMIAKLNEMQAEVNRFHYALDCEADEIRERWDGLGRVGAQREDHAAQLLGNLRYHLRDLRNFCAACERQIDAMVADPFGRNST